MYVCLYVRVMNDLMSSMVLSPTTAVLTNSVTRYTTKPIRFPFTREGMTYL